MGLAIPRFSSISHVRLRLSVKRTMRPGSPFGSSPRALARRAHSTWREPWPWHASQDTSFSEKVVRKRSLLEPVALAQVRGVALGALAVPALRGLRPVQHVAMVHALVRVEVEPALSPCPFGRLSHATESA